MSLVRYRSLTSTWIAICWLLLSFFFLGCFRIIRTLIKTQKSSNTRHYYINQPAIIKFSSSTLALKRILMAKLLLTDFFTEYVIMYLTTMKSFVFWIFTSLSSPIMIKAKVGKWEQRFQALLAGQDRHLKDLNIYHC